jgi:hypothetical protein
MPNLKDSIRGSSFFYRKNLNLELSFFEKKLKPRMDSKASLNGIDPTTTLNSNLNLVFFELR